MPTADTICRTKNVIRASLKLAAEVEISDDMALAGGEYDLDSLDILLIVTGIEKEFGIKINDASMNKSAFSSVQSLAAFVESAAANAVPTAPASSAAQ